MDTHSRFLHHLMITCLAISLAWLSGVPSALAQETEPADTLENVIVHEVEEGETLYSISRQYDVSLRQVQEWNELDDYTIYIGQDLIVGLQGEDSAISEMEELPEPAEEPFEEPEPSEEPDPEPEARQWPPVPPEYSVLPDLEGDPAPPIVEEASDRGTEEEMLPIDEEEEIREQEEAGTVDEYGWHEMEAGETLYSIAARYDLTVDTLRALNEPVSTYLPEGDSLRLPPSYAGYFHEVEEGETIADLARMYGVSIRGLQHVNNMETRELTTGQQLLIPGRPAPEPEPRGTLPDVSFEGQGEVFPEAFEGRLMAGGARYDPAELVVSHRDLPIGTVVLLSNPENGRNTFAAVADRGPPGEELIMDISQAVAEALGVDGERAHLEVRIVE